MNPVFDIGDLVTATTTLRNDGTYPEPGMAVGAVLVPAGTAGEVVNVGLYLQEHIVYAVAFGNGRLVGCLERELSARPAPGPPIPASAIPAASVTVVSVTASEEKGERP